jgi:hypothetical protein
VIWIRESEFLPNNITDDKIHYMLALPSADASAISTDFVRLLRPIYKPLSFATRVSATAWRVTLLQRNSMIPSDRLLNPLHGLTTSSAAQDHLLAGK